MTTQFVGMAADAPVAVFGGAGNDIIHGSGGGDWIDGGSGAGPDVWRRRQ